MTIKFTTQRLLTLMAMLFVVSTLSAQDTTSWIKKGWSVNLNGGASLFYGDVENYEFFPTTTRMNEWRMGYGIMLQKELTPIFTLRGQLFNGELAGSKREYRYWFEADILETSMSIKMDMINLLWGVKQRKFSIYSQVGIGLAHWTTELKTFDTNEQIAINGEDNTGSGLFGRTVEAVIPFGVGIDYNFSYNWSLNVEGTLRPVNSDRLDAKEGMFEYDFYSYEFIGLTYHFRKKQEAKMPELPGPDIIAQEEELPVEEVVVEEKPEQEIVQVPVVQEPEPEKTPIIVEDEQPQKEPQEPVKSVDDQLLKEEYRTGLYDSPWPDVEFTVQVAASRKYIEPEVLAERKRIPGKILVNEGNGWYRYSVGSYIKYWQARENRNILVTRHDAKDAFVVAYRDGERIMLEDLISTGTLISESSKASEQERIESQVSFSVQILATTNGNLSTQAIRQMFEIELPVMKELTGNIYQYTTGVYGTYQDAAKLRNKLKAKGLSGAFVVGYKDGKRVAISKVLN